MKVTPVAYDSMGVRSQATFVETDDLKLFIDPSASLGPIRFSHPPHAREWERLAESWEQIAKFAKKADAVVVGHYHYDHHDPDHRLEEIYEGRIVFVKHPKDNINQSQKKRAAHFLSKIGEIADSVKYADGSEQKFGRTKLEFSDAVFHGTNPRLGYVVETLVDDGYRFIHTNDVEGPAVNEQAEFILKNRPNLAFIDGPLSYIMLRYGMENMRKANENLIKILKSCPLDALVVDHHLLRDIGWRKRIEKVFEADKEGKVKTAAEYAGKETDQLEAKRSRLWKEFPDEKAKVNKKLEELVLGKEE